MLRRRGVRDRDHDVLLGEVGGCPFYIDDRQFEVWKHTQLILDVGAGEPEGFSLAAGEDEHFIIHSKVFSPAEQDALERDASGWHTAAVRDAGWTTTLVPVAE